MGATGFMGLDVWKKSKRLAGEIKRITKKLPKYEKFELADQMRRAADSTPSNISEGYGRNGRNEYLHFLGVAQGSNNELITQIYLCHEGGYLTKADTKMALSLAFDVSRMLRNLIASLEDEELDGE